MNARFSTHNVNIEIIRCAGSRSNPMFWQRFWRGYQMSNDLRNILHSRV